MLQWGQLVILTLLSAESLSSLPHLVNTYRDCLQGDLSATSSPFPLQCSLCALLSPELRVWRATSLAACVCGWTLLRDKLAKGERDTKVSEELFSPDRLTSGNSGGFLAQLRCLRFWLTGVYCMCPRRPLSKATLCTDSSFPCCSITVLQSMKLGIDVNRHKEIIVKSISALLLLLLKHFKLNHIYQVSSSEHFSTPLRCPPGPAVQRKNTRALESSRASFFVLRDSDTCCTSLGHKVGNCPRKLQMSVSFEHYPGVVGRNP